MDEKVVEMNLSLDENASKENEVTVETVKHYEDTNQAEVEGTLVSIYDTGKSVLMTVLTTTGKDKNETERRSFYHTFHRKRYGAAITWRMGT